MPQRDRQSGATQPVDCSAVQQSVRPGGARFPAEVHVIDAERGGEANQLFRPRNAAHHERGSHTGRGYLDGGQRRPMETADDDPLASRARGDHLRHGFGRTGILDLDQQIDRGALCERQEVGENNGARRSRLDLGEAKIGHEAIVDR